MPRIKIFLGNYGSGKTELSISEALGSPLPCALVDLDIVNPYFRSTDRQAMLEAAGIRVYSPSYAGTTLDIPALSAELTAVFYNKAQHVIFDVGGDPSGAAAIGGYKRFFLDEKEPPEVNFVINTKRPLSSNPDDIIALMDLIEGKSRQKITGLINNTNLSWMTEPEDLISGQEIVEEVSRRTGIPVKFVCGTEETLAALPESFKTRYNELLYTLHPQMRPDFLPGGETI